MQQEKHLLKIANMLEEIVFDQQLRRMHNTITSMQWANEQYQQADPETTEQTHTFTVLLNVLEQAAFMSMHGALNLLLKQEIDEPIAVLLRQIAADEEKILLARRIRSRNHPTAYRHISEFCKECGIKTEIFE